MSESHKSPVSFSIGSPQANAIEPEQGRGTPRFGGNGEKRFPALRLGPCVREKVFKRVLRTIDELVPEGGVLFVSQIAERGDLSRNDVRRSLAFLRLWRILWIKPCGKGAFEIRFDRRIAKGFVAAAAVAPAELPKFLIGHRAKREAIAPFHKSVAAAATSNVDIAKPSAGPGRVSK